MQIKIHPIQLEDCVIIHTAFKAQGWDKPVSLYEQYLQLQENKERDVLVAKVDQVFAGYLTINWKAGYPPFREKGIPEIVDFNVLKKFQRKGVGSALMDEAESRMSKVSKFAGLGFGVTKDYGAAQILYIKRGYIPNGDGLVLDGKPVNYGDQITVSHSLALILLKKL